MIIRLKNSNQIDVKGTGCRSNALYTYHHEQLGNTVTQFLADLLSLDSEGNLLYDGNPIDCTEFDAVLKRTTTGDNVKETETTGYQQIFEDAGCIPDNPAASQLISQDKIKTREVLTSAGIPMPLGTPYKSKENLKGLQSFLYKIDSVQTTKGVNQEIYPAYVLKNKSGTHGTGLEMFYSNEKSQLEEKIKESISKGEELKVEEYIVPELINGINVTSKEEKAAAHRRIVMSKDENGEYKLIGQIVLQREGAWVSNSGNDEGVGYSRNGEEYPIPQVLESDLAEAAKAMGLNHFGADVIIEKGGKEKYYILELNDSMGISGTYLELQSTAKKFAQCFTARAKKQLFLKGMQTATNTGDKKETKKRTNQNQNGADKKMRMYP